MKTRKITFFHFLLVASFVIVSCDDDSNESLMDSSGLFVNEFLASNSACWADESGEFDDWVELYNSSLSSIDVGGMYITDRLEGDLYLIPSTDATLTTVPSKGYLILWFDKDEAQGPHHIGEKLSGDGEGIYLLSDSTTIVDSLSFEVQETDVSMGRLPDGTDNWVKFVVPSPGATNNTGI